MLGPENDKQKVLFDGLTTLKSMAEVNKKKF
jgi:hypothetical protein